MIIVDYRKGYEVTMYKACIFDLDGTLTNTLDSLVYSTNETLKEMKLPQISEEQCRLFVGNGARAVSYTHLPYSIFRVLIHNDEFVFR